MTSIHQLYATHCTYGTSALEQREGELAERVLGYSARAGSLERTELRNCYRQVERFLYYYLPTDAPTEEKLRLDAASAPRRMFFCPSLGDLQVLGQISYRQQDTAGRPGSYFGHVLFGRRAEGAWSVLDCLKLWSASWIDEDAPDLAAKLPALKSLDDLLSDKPPAIDDSVLSSFLKTPLGESFDDPGKIIPERWKYIEPAQRAELLTETLQGFLNLGSQRRESLLLVIEPPVAALVFYGVARLLPPGAVRDSISFSTFEPNADRIPVSLAATVFHSPEVADLRPEAYRRRGYVSNTFLDRHSDHGRPEGFYGALLVDTLLSQGFQGVDQLCSGFQAAGAKTPEDLELLADIHRLVPQVLNPEVPLGETRWRQSDVAVRYLSLAVHRQLANDEAGWPQLRGLIGSPNQLLVMELIASAPDAGDIQAPLQFLLRKLPPERFGEMLQSVRLPRSAKIEALAYYVSSVGRFPEQCESLWNEGSRLNNLLAGRAEPLLPGILARLPAQVIGPLYRTLPPEMSDIFLRALLQAARPEPELQAAQRAVTAGIFKELDDERFVDWLLNHREELRHYFPPPDDVLRPRLAKLLFEIPDHPQQLENRLTALEGWVDYFSEPSLAERRIVQWQKIRSILSTIRESEQRAPVGRLEAVFRKPGQPDYRGLAEALNTAMPMTVYQDDMRGTKKLECLQGLGRAMLHKSDFLPPVVRSRMIRYFEYGDWSEFSSGRNASKKTAGKKKSVRQASARKAGWQKVFHSKLFAFGGGIAVIFLGGLAYSFFARQSVNAPSETRLSGGIVGDAGQPGETLKTGTVSTSAHTSDKASSGKVEGKATAIPPTAADAKNAGSDTSNGEIPPRSPKSSNAVAETKSASEQPAGDPAMKQEQAKSNHEKAAANSAEPPTKTKDTPSALQEPAEPAIAEHTQLPSFETNQLATYQPSSLVKWDAPPANVRLALHGVEFATAEIARRTSHVKERAEISSEWANDQLKVAMRLSGQAQMTPLAAFSVTDKALSFQWRQPTRSVAVTACQTWLRACVLEIQSAAGSRYVALSDATKLEPLELSGGTARIPARGWKFDMPLRALDFRLGRGMLRLHDDRRFDIVPDVSADQPALVVGLGEEYGFAAVRLAFQRDPDQEDGWTMRLLTEEKPELLELKKQRDRLQSEISQLSGPLGRFKDRDSTGDRKAEAIRELEVILGADEPPARSGGQSSTSNKPGADKPKLVPADEHLRERRIADKAEQRRNVLQRRLEDLSKQMKQQQGRNDELLSNAGAISAVLYRLVDERIRVDCAILGDAGDQSVEREGTEQR